MDAIEQGELVGLGLIDLSAAFDCVDADLLLKKTKLYNFSRHAQQFVWTQGCLYMDSYHVLQFDDTDAGHF